MERKTRRKWWRQDTKKKMLLTREEHVWGPFLSSLSFNVWNNKFDNLKH
jgi:hypothetical protein